MTRLIAATFPHRHHHVSHTVAVGQHANFALADSFELLQRPQNGARVVRTKPILQFVKIKVIDLNIIFGIVGFQGAPY